MNNIWGWTCGKETREMPSLFVPLSWQNWKLKWATHIFCRGTCDYEIVNILSLKVLYCGDWRVKRWVTVTRAALWWLSAAQLQRRDLHTYLSVFTSSVFTLHFHHLNLLIIFWQTLNINIFLCAQEKDKLWGGSVCLCLSTGLICSCASLSFGGELYATCRERGAQQSIRLLITYTHGRTQTPRLMVTARSEYERRGRNEREGLSRWVWRDLDLKQSEKKRQTEGERERERWWGKRMTHWACKCLTALYRC